MGGRKVAPRNRKSENDLEKEKKKRGGVVIQHSRAEGRGHRPRHSRVCIYTCVYVSRDFVCVVRMLSQGK